MENTVVIGALSLIHIWLSQDYPKYTFEETQKKIEQSRKVGIYRGCNYIAQNHYEICKGCPKAEAIIRRFKNDR